jgi:hypothetical protein
MTHMQPMAETEGEFTSEHESKHPCRKCGGPARYQVWESNCGGYEDYKYTCTKCGYVWWIDGLDA